MFNLMDETQVDLWPSVGRLGMQIINGLISHRNECRCSVKVTFSMTIMF